MASSGILFDTMGSNFDASFFVANRERLRSLFTGTAPIVLTANGVLQRNGDVTFPFRQDSSFWYYTGISEPDLVLVIDKSKEYLIAPGREEHRKAFDGEVDFTALTQQSGIQTVLPEKDGWKQLSTRLKKVKHVATLAPPPAFVAYHGLYTNPARARLLRSIKQYNPEIEVLGLKPQITHMRAIKQTQELEALQAAIDITVSTLKHVTKKGLEIYQREYELEAAITANFRKSAAQHAYQPIVAVGANACTLHYIDNDHAITPGELLLVDVGAEHSNYAADITRTYAVGEPTRRQRQVYDAVLAVWQFAIDQLKPGVLLRDYEESVQQLMGEKLRELGLIKLIDQDTVRRYYPHATSHFLGLDVHDVADYERLLEPGMVLTVEPGIYIHEEGLGIRIEDDVLITAQGNKILSDALPRVLELT